MKPVIEILIGLVALVVVVLVGMNIGRVSPPSEPFHSLSEEQIAEAFNSYPQGSFSTEKWSFFQICWSDLDEDGDLDAVVLIDLESRGEAENYLYVVRNKGEDDPELVVDVLPQVSFDRNVDDLIVEKGVLSVTTSSGTTHYRLKKSQFVQVN
jgi:hypothetical protein